MAKKHWSETYACSCGKKFRSYAAEAQHRHNFPLLCRQKGQKSSAFSRAFGDALAALTAVQGQAKDADHQ